MKRFWVSWWTIDVSAEPDSNGAWGFPWHWQSGSREDVLNDSHVQSIVALIAAEDEEDAWRKATWLTGEIGERRFCNLVEKDFDPGDRFPVKEWWPAPEFVWSHMDDEGHSREYWDEKKATEFIKSII